MSTGKPDADELARRLQTSLRRRRVSPSAIILGVLALAIVALGAAAWSLLLPRTEAPLPQVVALDDVVPAGEVPRVRAVLVATEDGARLGGQEIVFIEERAVLAPGQAPQQVKAETDGAGRAEARWPLPDGATGAEFLARHIDARRRQGSVDRGRIFVWPKDASVVLIEVEVALAERPARGWGEALPAEVKLRAGVVEMVKALTGGGRHVVYLVTAAGPESRRVRTWVEGRITAAGLPPGPVLDRANYPGADLRGAAVGELRERFPGEFEAVVGNEADVAVYRALGVKARVAD